MKNDIKKIQQKILPILRSYNVKRAALFGSCVKGVMRKDSDVDILVDIKKDISLLDFIGIKLELESVLKRKVDLVEYDTIKPLLKQKILREQMKIL